MSSETIELNVYPNLTQTVKIVKAQITVLDMVLFRSVSLRVVLLNDADVPVDVKILKLDETNGYTKWGSDDAFIVDWVSQQLKIGKYS